ncbi:MAG TPA: FtsX-like permease family protein [Solirubrobacter sp.]|nr:FtsX-like permease family protein [Solirubrobacter sp.]
MSSALGRKSLTDLTRRKARTIFTVLTLALAVASVGIFAVPSLMQRSMEREVARNQQPDVTVSMKPLQLSAARLAALQRLPNVVAIEPRSLFATRVWVGERREPALVVGVPDFAHQRADIVFVDDGAVPRAGTLLTDRGNASRKGFGEDTARLLAADGATRTLAITGVGRNLTDGMDDPTNDWITFYATTDTVAALSGAPGYTSLGLRLRDPSRPAAERTVAALRDALRETTAFTAFDDLPAIREARGYPGKEQIENLAGVLRILTLLALASALVLVSSTMTTLIGEQTSEIAAMKAIGARRRDIRRLYLRTALLLGAIGAVVGTALGILLANVIAAFFASLLYADAAFGVSVPIVVASLVLGHVGPALAALPAIRRASRLPLHEALQATGSATGGMGRIDRLLRRARGLPRPAQIGLRGVARRLRRTVATVAQIALAVATLLALLSLGSGVAETTRGWFDDNHFDVWVQTVASEPFGAEAQRLIFSTEGVRGVQAWTQNTVRFQGRDVAAWGLPARPLMDAHMVRGRWYSDAEARDGGRVAVLGQTLASTTSTDVGDRITVTTSAGPATLEVIGVSGNQANNGGVMFMPLATLQDVLGSPGAVNSYWLTTTSPDHALIDRTTTRVEDTLAANGHQVLTTVMYDAREQQVAANATLTTMITVLGLLIVAISMVALVNTITMAVLERTREIGMLRSVGARARDIRRIFATEGLVVAVCGWLAGVPLGYLFARAIGWASGEAVGLEIAFVFPVGYVALALAGTVILALLVMLGPIRRAVSFKPGEAIRYA